MTGKDARGLDRHGMQVFLAKPSGRNGYLSERETPGKR
jgi:hypothetical protein